MKTVSKIKKITPDGTDNTDYGELYKYVYEFEDAEVVSARHKTQTPFKIGDAVEYLIKGEFQGVPFGTVSKHKENNFNGFSKDTKGIEVGHAINNAVNMLCAGVVFENVDPELKTGQKIAEYARNILAISKKLKDE